MYINLSKNFKFFNKNNLKETCAAIKGFEKNVDHSLRIGFEWLIKHIDANYNDLKERTDKEFSDQRSREKNKFAESKRKVEEKKRFEK